MCLWACDVLLLRFFDDAYQALGFSCDDFCVLQTNLTLEIAPCACCRPELCLCWCSAKTDRLVAEAKLTLCSRIQKWRVCCWQPFLGIKADRVQIKISICNITNVEQTSFGLDCCWSSSFSFYFSVFFCCWWWISDQSLTHVISKLKKWRNDNGISTEKDCLKRGIQFLKKVFLRLFRRLFVLWR